VLWHLGHFRGYASPNLRHRLELASDPSLKFADGSDWVWTTGRRATVMTGYAKFWAERLRTFLTRLPGREE
jgi:hypothetical protein